MQAPILGRPQVTRLISDLDIMEVQSDDDSMPKVIPTVDPSQPDAQLIIPPAVSDFALASRTSAPPMDRMRERPEGAPTCEAEYIVEIRKLAKQGLKPSEIARRLGVSRQRIHMFVRAHNLVPSRDEKRKNREAIVRALHKEGFNVGQIVKKLERKVSYETVRRDHVRLGLEPHRDSDPPAPAKPAKAKKK